MGGGLIVVWGVVSLASRWLVEFDLVGVKGFSFFCVKGFSFFCGRELLAGFELLWIESHWNPTPRALLLGTTNATEFLSPFFDALDHRFDVKM